MVHLELVKLLINVVTRGGNLALNLGAQPDGRLPRNGMKAALGLGEWLETYGEAIFATRAVKSDYEHGEFGFTRKGDCVYALKPLGEGETLPDKVLVPWSGPVTNAFLAGSNAPLAVEPAPGGLLADIPENERGGKLALVIKLV